MPVYPDFNPGKGDVSGGGVNYFVAGKARVAHIVPEKPFFSIAIYPAVFVT